METPHLFSLDHWLFRKGRWEGYHIPRHFNLWTAEGMKRLVEQAGFTDLATQKKIKPVHWTISLQNMAIARKAPRWVVRFFDLRNPVLLALFGVVDVLQLLLLRKSSDVRYVATR